MNIDTKIPQSKQKKYKQKPDESKKKCSMKTGLVGQARELSNNVLTSLIFDVTRTLFLLLQNEYKHALEDVTDVWSL